MLGDRLHFQSFGYLAIKTSKFCGGDVFVCWNFVKYQLIVFSEIICFDKASSFYRFFLVIFNKRKVVVMRLEGAVLLLSESAFKFLLGTDYTERLFRYVLHVFLLLLVRYLFHHV